MAGADAYAGAGPWLHRWRPPRREEGVGLLVEPPAFNRCVEFFAPSTSQTGCTVCKRISFLAHRADHKLAPMAFPEAEAVRNPDPLDAAYVPPCPLRFVQKTAHILFFLGLQLEEPRLELGPRRDSRRVYKDADSLTRLLVVEGQRESSHVDHREPSIARGTRREE